MEYLDFDYVIINPKNLIGIDEFNQSFFDKIDQIEIDISNEIEFNSIVSGLEIKPINKKNFRLSSDSNEIEKKYFNLEIILMMYLKVETISSYTKLEIFKKKNLI